jgi:LuxR family maltose regulon positive regulatory protein
MPRHAAPDVPDQTLPRPRLERRLDEGVHRRLTAVVAGAGYGKSTLVARWAQGRDDVVWYALDALDGSVARLVRGLTTALEPLAGPEPTDLRAILTSAGPAAADGTETGGVDRGRSDALADLVCEHLASTDGPVTIVLDDLQELWPGGDSMRFVERLVRGAPSNVHVVLVSRSGVPFPIERVQRVPDHVVAPVRPPRDQRRLAVPRARHDRRQPSMDTLIQPPLEPGSGQRLIRDIGGRLTGHRSR